MSADDIQVRYARALEAFTNRLREDSQVVAAILAGSMSYDTVWERSDIDMTIVVQEQSLKERDFSFIEDGIIINGGVVTRNQLKRWIGRSLSGSMHHSFLVRSTLLFTKDPTVNDIYEDLRRVGSRDRENLIMMNGMYLLGDLDKTEKWLTVKNDPRYASVFLTMAVSHLATVVTLLHGEVPMREVIHQAMQYERELFGLVYEDLLDAPKTAGTVRRAFDAVVDYLKENTQAIFKAMLDYLAEEAEFRTVREISEHFSHVNDGHGVAEVCTWLVSQGLLGNDTSEVRLTPKSRTMVLESAFVSATGLAEGEL